MFRTALSIGLLAWVSLGLAPTQVLASETAKPDSSCTPLTLEQLGFSDIVDPEERLKLERRGFPKAKYSCWFSDPEQNTSDHCGYTDETSSGPYYVAATPIAYDGNLNPTNEPGDPMRLTVRVFDGKTGKPIPGTRIETYTVDSKGEYNPYAPGFAEQFDDVRMRATIISSEGGSAVGTSIVPAPYENRRRHIHYYFTAEGYYPLFTQSYWAGDPNAEIDPIDRNSESCRTLDWDTVDGVSVATFNVYMRPLPDG